MKATFKGKKITGILGVLPENVSCFDDEVDNYSFPAKQTLRLKKVMGFEKHRLSKQKSTGSDFCIFGLNHLLEQDRIRKDEIGAVIVVSLSPDYFVPHISNIIHGECGLPSDVLCMDIPQGCCGYLLGLMQSFLLLDILKNKKVVLFNVDILSHKVSRQDRNDFPLIGDAASVSIIENDDSAKDIYFELYSDGSQRDALIIPAGGFAMPCTAETAIMREMDDGNCRSLDNLQMEGSEIFNFVQTKIPPLIENMFKELDISKDEIEYYLFHQPNKFMLKKLADKLSIPYDKMYMNIVENFGNPSGVSIPINIVFNMKDLLIEHHYKCCLSAFGSGLTWGAIVMQLGNLDFCEMIESNL